MSAYDDRLAALEQKVTTLTHDLVATQSDFFTHLGGFSRSIATLNKAVSDQEMDARDLHHNMAILLGVVGDQGKDIKAIKADLGALKVNVEALEQNLGNRFDILEGRMGTLEGRFDAQDKKLDQVLSMLSQLTSGTQQET